MRRTHEGFDSPRSPSMEWIALLGLVSAAVAFVATRPRPAVQPAPEVPPVKPPAPAPNKAPSADGKPKLPKVPKLGKILELGAGGATILGPGTAGALGAGTALGGAAGTAALVAGAGALGFVITGDAGGAAGAVGLMGLQVANGTGIVQAQAGNVGRVVGRELDKLFNGDLGNGGTSTLYQATGFFTGAVLSIGGLAALPAVGQLALLVVGIGEAVSEANRLAYGQAGAVRDATTEARGFYDATLASLRKSFEASYPGVPLSAPDEARLKTIAAYMAIGWAFETQASRQRIVSSSPGPLFVAPGVDRNRWAWARGLLVQDMGPVTAALQALSGGADVDAFQAQVKGREIANVGHYLKVRLEQRGIGSTMRQHLEHWQQRGAFTALELYAEGDAFTAANDSNDSIRLGPQLWVAGAESAKQGRLVTTTY